MHKHTHKVDYERSEYMFPGLTEMISRDILFLKIVGQMECARSQDELQALLIEAWAVHQSMFSVPVDTAWSESDIATARSFMQNEDGEYAEYVRRFAR